MKYMLVETEESIAQEWEKYRGFTVRPLPSLIHYYQAVIEAHLFYNDFLLLGGTPEIRTIFQRLNKPITLFDKSVTMLHAMGRLTVNQKSLSDNEYILESDWLEPDFSKRNVPFIIADDAINMVTWENFEKFIRNIYRTLDDDGIFVCHLLVKPDDTLIEKKFSDILHEFETRTIKSKFDLASRLNFICFDKKNYAMGWQQTIKKLGKPQLNKLKPSFDFVETFGNCNSKFYCPPQVEFEKLAIKYFRIEEIFYAHEYEYCMFEPVYLLKKRKQLA